MNCGCDMDLKLCLPVGTSPIWGFTVTDPDNAGAAVAGGIAGATFEMFVKSAASDADAAAVYSLTSAASEIVIISAALATVQILNETAKTALLTIGAVYYWSLRVTFTSGENRVIRAGKLFAEAP